MRHTDRSVLPPSERPGRAPDQGRPEQTVDDVARAIADKVPELTKLDPAGRERAIRQLVAVDIGFSGPLPPPDMLARYDEIIPNGADRLLSMVEADLTHSHQMQAGTLLLQRDVEARRDRVARSEQTYRMSGLAAGFLAFCAALSLTGFLAQLGHLVLAGLFGGTTLVGVVGTFVYGRRHAPGPPDARPPDPPRPANSKKR